MSKIAAKPTSRAKIRKTTELIRKIAQAEDYFDVVRFLEHRLPMMDEDFELCVLADEEMHGYYAKAYPDQHKIEVRQSVYLGAIENIGGHRFTLCHELGHYFMHGSERISYPRTQEKIQAYEDPEWQANTFAGELLVPANIARNFTVSEISQRCGVSNIVAFIQKKQVLNTKK